MSYSLSVTEGGPRQRSSMTQSMDTLAEVKAYARGQGVRITFEAEYLIIEAKDASKPTDRFDLIKLIPLTSKKEARR